MLPAISKEALSGHELLEIRNEEATVGYPSLKAVTHVTLDDDFTRSNAAVATATASKVLKAILFVTTVSTTVPTMSVISASGIRCAWIIGEKIVCGGSKQGAARDHRVLF